MSDWQVGDLALCVVKPKPDPGITSGWSPAVGSTYTVMEVARDMRGVVLNFFEDAAYDPYCGFDAFCFRKIRPDKHEDCEPEFVELLNRVKRKVSA